MPPKAMEKTEIDDMLCELMPKGLSKNAKLAMLNDPDLKAKNVAFEYNLRQLNDVGASVDITNDYGLMVIYATQCIEALKNIWK